MTKGDCRRVRAPCAPLLAALLTGLTLVACAEADGPSPGGARLAGALAGDDCLIIVLDALRADHLGCYGADPSPSPTLDALAARGVRMAWATSQASWTLPSTASLFTGLYQETHGLQFGPGLEKIRLVDDAVTLAELFSSAGYETSSWTQNAFAGRTYGLHQGFDENHLGTRFVEGDEQMPQRVAELLAAPTDRPRLVYVHLRRPHSPFDPPAEFLPPDVAPLREPDGEDVGTTEAVIAHNTWRRRLDADERERHQALYRGNIAAADALVAEVLEGVDLERTLVLVLSDHGEAFGEHGKLGHNWLSFQEYVHIPFILVHPALPEGMVLEAPVMSVDVLPTLATLFGLDVADLPLQGSSLVPLLDGGSPPRRAAVFTSSRKDGRGQHQLAAFDGRFKLVRLLPSGKEALYDLTLDPGETLDVASAHPGRARRLSDLLTRWHASQQPGLAAPGDALPPEERSSLEALGYIGNQ